MTVCYFGIYDRNYSRSRILLRGLRDHGAVIVECNSRVRGFKKYLDLYRQHRRLRNRYDVMLVGFTGHIVMPFARLITGKKIYFDAFVSLYNTMVETRRSASRFSISSLYYYFLDWLSCTLADAVIMDTNKHIEYLSRTYRINRNKFILVRVGCDDEVFYPRTVTIASERPIEIVWWGWASPLHGVEHILEASRRLLKENVHFTLLGGLELARLTNSAKSKKRYANVTVLPPVAYEELPSVVATADICLGVFGDVAKLDLVIPNKIYEALACQKALITAESVAIREALVNTENCLLCRRGSADDLAQKIMVLVKNHSLRERLARSGHRLFRENFRPANVVKDLFTAMRDGSPIKSSPVHS